jgi:hypothetical protein
MTKPRMTATLVKLTRSLRLENDHDNSDDDHDDYNDDDDDK